MKRFFRVFLVAFLFLITLFTLALLVKPGSRLFYWPFRMALDKVFQTDDAFGYDLTINEKIFDVDTLLLLEDNRLLTRLQPYEGISDEPGVFEVDRTGKNRFLITFIPVESFPLSETEEVFRVIVRPHFVTSSFVLFGFLFFALILINVFLPILLNPEKRRTFICGESQQVMKIAIAQVFPPCRMKAHRFVLLTSFRHIVLFSLAYVFLEWLFLVTMPSFMDILSFWEKLKIPIVSFGVVSLFLVLILFLLVLLRFFLDRFFPLFHLFTYQMPVAFLTACLILLLMDNFTYTVFGFGIVNASPYFRPFYALFFVEIFLFTNRRLRSKLIKLVDKKKERLLVGALLVLLSIPVLVAGLSLNPVDARAQQQSSVSEKLPNIILLSNDGLNASNMSVYGYSNQTTPFMEELARTSLLSLNNFTNAAHSTGSDTSILTGKSPLETRVLYPPDALLDQDMYQHLPGLLKQYGYRTVSLGIKHYMDVNEINFQNGFDSVNCVEAPKNEVLRRGYRYGFGSELKFLLKLRERIVDRLLHIFFLKDMQNYFTAVTQAIETSKLSDDARYACLFEELSNSSLNEQPLFVHVHNMATHGPMFSPEITEFSANLSQDEPWMTAFYDDAILSYDEQVRHLVEYLQTLGVFDHTILVLYTDHGQNWTTTDRIPLIFHFPGGEYAGEINVNTQNLDIAPTILDYLGMDQPGWMSGSSLLGNLEPTRLILSAAADPDTVDHETGVLKTRELNPPFYQFWLAYVIQCQKVYIVDLKTLSMEETFVDDYVDPCDLKSLDPPGVIWDKLGMMLTDFGYELPEDW